MGLKFTLTILFWPSSCYKAQKPIESSQETTESSQETTESSEEESGAFHINPFFLN